ncbi:MAG: ribonuclease R [Flavobacteriales bacterium]|nr:ribonuclease R [Flavobacteriales bacterium]
MTKRKLKPATLKKLKKKIRHQVLQVLIDAGGKAMNYKQIAARMEERDNKVKLLIVECLKELTQEEKLVEKDKGKYAYDGKPMNILEGTIDISKWGRGYLISDEREEDVLIPKKYVGRALNGDRVLVELYKKKNDWNGKVVSILERKTDTFVGIVNRSNGMVFLDLPNNSHISLFIPKGKDLGAEDGIKAVGRMTDWPESTNNPFGEIIEVLGSEGEARTELDAIMWEFNLPREFNQETLAQADKLKVDVSEGALKGRKDLRQITTFTIDPDDAKDFDDALSYTKLGDDIELGIHIADVSHFVREGDPIDKEALNRGTSVYLVDQVVPMLPEILSNNLCSLRPNEDKYCFSVIVKMDQSAKVKEHWIGRAIINSDRRFTYQEAQEIIDGSSGDHEGELRHLHDLSQKMRRKRLKDGALAFSGTEFKFKLDEDHQPVEIIEKKMGTANQLVEEFMLLANRLVAEEISNNKKNKRPFVYRIHDKPDPAKLTELQRFVGQLGYELKTDVEHASHDLNALIDSAKGKPEEKVISQMAIRTMAKAEYSVDNIGHYGLAFENYSHFTSPIRRYPDLLAHRLVEVYLVGKTILSEAEIEKRNKHCSIMEKRASDAERASVKYMQALYMSKFIGHEFEGIVSGLTKWGIYVELSNKCEGMIPLISMRDDKYYFEEDSFMVIGKRYKEVFKMGQNLKVRVADCDVLKRQVDLELVED